MEVDQRLNYLARVLAVVAGYQAEAAITEKWLRTILESSSSDDLEQATAALIKSLDDRQASARALALSALELGRKLK